MHLHHHSSSCMLFWHCPEALPLNVTINEDYCLVSSFPKLVLVNSVLLTDVPPGSTYPIAFDRFCSMIS